MNIVRPVAGAPDSEEHRYHGALQQVDKAVVFKESHRGEAVHCHCRQAASPTLLGFSSSLEGHRQNSLAFRPAPLLRPDHRRQTAGSLFLRPAGVRAGTCWEMKDIVGSPGRRSGLALRVSQFACAMGSMVAMIHAFGFSNYTAYLYLTFTMAFEILWSFLLICIDIHALRYNLDLHRIGNVWKYVLGDWYRNA
ncbi:hypothetical protein PR202_gn00505 [Eleusine coracana subsp. coracana]|uniref:CASP-like protein n=1 Tax=Eleusine coracana subsp. coracana TaxID=191504 RepID=A0AAV5G334_ELECO|nr:hypothetical protein PR202_gn00505 [Eleusine coracana subsp. coracana]